MYVRLRLLNNTEFVGAIPDLSGFEKVEKM